MDTNISEKHAASIFKVEKCGFRNRLCYIGRLQGEEVKK
jgi:hypothetical protein